MDKAIKWINGLPVFFQFWIIVTVALVAVILALGTWVYICSFLLHLWEPAGGMFIFLSATGFVAAIFTGFFGQG